jgi:hypothetical protein
MHDCASGTPNAPRWRTTGLIVGVWLVGCPLAGTLIAFLDGEFGSIGYVVIGTYVGASGALFHLLLTRYPAYLRCSYPLQVLISAGAGAVPILLFSMALDPRGLGNGFLQDDALPIAGFSVFAAWLGVEILHRRSV